MFIHTHARARTSAPACAGSALLLFHRPGPADRCVQSIAQRLNVPLDFVRTGHGAARDRPLVAASDHEAVTNATDVFCAFYDERLFDAVAGAAADEIRMLGFGPQVSRHQGMSCRMQHTT
jgi:hypothetical protein